MNRVAVLGVPRGGTSLVVGLLRILGYQLPAQDPDCLFGESRTLRWADSPLGGDVRELVRLVGQVPGGVVWKDPAVGLYCHGIDWTQWRTVRVVRDLDAVVASEVAHGSTEDPGYLRERAEDWGAALDRVVVPDVLVSLEAIVFAPGPTFTALGMTLTGVAPSVNQQAMARSFVDPDGGYSCPLPWSCELHQREGDR